MNNAKPLTRNEAQYKGYYVHTFDTGTYSYEINGTQYLIRNGKEIAKGDFVRSYSNDDCSYKIDDTYHLVRNGKEIAKGEYVYSFANGDYEYKVNGKVFFFNKDGK